MRKEIKEVKEKKSIKLNISFINFIEKVKIEKLEKVNKEKLEEIYLDIVNLRSSNIDRVYNRVMRKELKEILSNELKERELSLEEFKKIGDSIVNKFKENKKSKFIKVEI